MEDEVSLLKRELEDVREDLQLKTDEYNELVSASSLVEAELEKDLMEVERKAEKWRQQAQRFEDEMRDAREKMAAHFRESATLQHELDVTKEKLESLTMAKSRWETEVDHLATQVRILEASNEDLKHQLEKALEDKVFLQSDYAEIEKEYELTSERFRTEILDLKSELFAVKLKQNGQPNATSNEEQQRDTIRESLLSTLIDENPFRPSLSLERDMEENEMHIQILQEELRELGDRLQEEETRRGQLEAQLLDMHARQAHMEAMEVEISEMSDELIYKAEQVRRAENEVTILQTKLGFALSSVEAMLSSAKEQHELEIDELRKKLDESKAISSTQEQSFNELTMLRAEYSQLEALHSQTKAQLEIERARFQQLSEELEQSKNATEAVQQELEDLRQQYAELQKEHEESLRQSQPIVRPARSRSIDGSANDMAQKYLLERKRNAMLLSRLQNLTGNMQVLCRVRPLLAHDPSHQSSELSIDVLNLTDVAAMEMKADVVDPNVPWKVFSFDRVLGPQSSQADVFREVEPLAQAVVDGYKACIFAYGQTGSGKTYTMGGTEHQPGLNYRLVAHIFDSILLRGTVVADASALESFNKETEQPVYHLQVGVYEIYNETIRDLLHPKHPTLDIRTDENGDVGVPGLHMENAFNPNHALEILSQAQKNRASCATNVHNNSSRSHCVVLLTMKSNAGQRGSLYLVDLAGSERIKTSGDHVLKETASINKSLAALGDVMEALDKKQTHVPYRNSKLTYALQDVLGSSQCKTVMILNVGPGRSTASETYRSMQFAERARRIVFSPNGIKPRQRGLLSGKQAFTEIKSLKAQVAAANSKMLQVNQTLASMKREHKVEIEKMTALLDQKTKALDEAKNVLNSLKTSNSDLSEKLQQERDMRRQESAQAEQESKQRRQLQSKTKVSVAHKESLEKLLFDRENEVVKLRQSLNEARRRSQNSLIPRLSLEGNQQNAVDLFKRMTVEDPVSSASETELDSESSDKPVPAKDHNVDEVPSKRKAIGALRVPIAVAAIEGAIRKPLHSADSKTKIPRRAFGSSKQSPREDNQASNSQKQSAIRRMWK
ncbi:unnamed protein product [Aphanomyces euteiches]